MKTKMNSTQLIKNNRGFISLQSLVWIVCFIFMLISSIFVFYLTMPNDKPEEILKRYNTTCIINKTYSESDDDSTNYYLVVTSGDLSCTINDSDLYSKYKDQEGIEVPAEITEYKTKDGNIVKQITKVL